MALLTLRGILAERYETNRAMPTLHALRLTTVK
jgi:hypothetical protein